MNAVLTAAVDGSVTAQDSVRWASWHACIECVLAVLKSSGVGWGTA
ncbi:hypothetical protein ABT052_42550 [Streptomyces sp. NPDC002766]